MQWTMQFVMYSIHFKYYTHTNYTMANAFYLHQAWQYIEQGHRMEAPENTPKLLYNDVMGKCWIYEPVKRPTFHEIVTILRVIQSL